MTLTEARDALLAKYQGMKLVPVPIVGVKITTYSDRQVLGVYVSKMQPNYVPEESKPGVGYEGFEVVSYLGLSTLISDSGVIS